MTTPVQGHPALQGWVQEWHLDPLDLQTCSLHCSAPCCHHEDPEVPSTAAGNAPWPGRLGAGRACAWWSEDGTRGEVRHRALLAGRLRLGTLAFMAVVLTCGAAGPRGTQSSEERLSPQYSWVALGPQGPPCPTSTPTLLLLPAWLATQGRLGYGRVPLATSETSHGAH